MSLIRTNILRMETTGVTQDVGEQDTRVNVDVIDAPGIPAATDFEPKIQLCRMVWTGATRKLPGPEDISFCRGI